MGLLLGVLIIFVIGSGVRYGGANHTPKLTTSCTTPALALSASTVRRGGPLYLAITGPDRTVVVALDAARLAPDFTATALAGARETQVVRPAVKVERCKGSSVLGVQVSPGAHTVSVFPAAGGEPLTSRPLTVTDR